MKKVIYTAAHSGFNLGEVPLGGGASVCQHLIQEWTRQKPFEWDLLGPELLGKEAPRNKDLVRYSELEYARFCHDFEKKLTQRILQSDPSSTVVLSNDISEGPDFKALAARGYSMYSIYHVDVVDYFVKIYLHSLVRPEWTTALFRGVDRAGFSRVVPTMLRLVWPKQEASVRFSRGLIVPSQRMKDMLLRCYPGVPAPRIHVLPWGAWDDTVSPDDINKEKKSLQEEFALAEGSWKLLTLSRISPEKGQDRLLKALALWEKSDDFPPQGIDLMISGEAAYMMGKRYEKELKRLAARLKRCRVHFTGYAVPARKQALFETVDLYVFPSRHESYGLTLLEALRAGRPVLATPSHGAQDIFQAGFGHMTMPVSEHRVPESLMQGLKTLLSDRRQLGAMGKAARAWAETQNFSAAASRLAELLASQ